MDEHVRTQLEVSDVLIRAQRTPVRPGLADRLSKEYVRILNTLVTARQQYAIDVIELHHHRGMSYTQIATHLGVKRSMISQITSGTKHFSEEKWNALATTLGNNVATEIQRPTLEEFEAQALMHVINVIAEHELHDYTFRAPISREDFELVRLVATVPPLDLSEVRLNEICEEVHALRVVASDHPMPTQRAREALSQWIYPYAAAIRILPWKIPQTSARGA